MVSSSSYGVCSESTAVIFIWDESPANTHGTLRDVMATHDINGAAMGIDYYISLNIAYESPSNVCGVHVVV